LEDYFEQLYSSDPLFRSLVDSRYREDSSDAGTGLSPCPGSLSAEEEIEILREYAIALYKEHKTLKGLFMESLRVTGQSVGVRAQKQRKISGDGSAPKKDSHPS
jgi:hypothetical protein